MTVLLMCNGKYCNISMETEVSKLDLSILIQYERYFQKLNGTKMCHQFVLN